MDVKDKAKSSIFCPSNARRCGVGTILLLASVCIYFFSLSGFSPNTVSTYDLRRVISKKIHQVNDVIQQMAYHTKGADSGFIVDGAEMGWTPYMDIIDEQTALKDPPIVDVRKTVSVNNSKVYITGNASEFLLGDTIRVRIDLYDGYGNRRQKWGDQLRARIFEQSLGASAAGYVVDHRNGSYTAIVRCLWVGNPTILVYMAYTREAIRALYYVRKATIATRQILAEYSKGERQVCHPFAHRLGNVTSLCNMTSINGGMSLYCRAPIQAKSKCKDFKMFWAIRQPLPFSSIEENLFKRNMEHLTPIINIKVVDFRNTTASTEQKPPCSSYNRTKLWFQPSPVGHFFRNKWKPIHCREPSTDTFEKCLQNKHILFYGDSTVRQWFEHVLKRFHCKLTTAKWTQEKWKKNSAAVCHNNNLTIEWIVHSIPGNLGGRRQINSIARNMLKFADNKNAIFLIHLLCHLTSYHHSVFRDRISHIRKSVEAVLKANRDAKILIKGGHTFQDFRVVSDYYSYVYRTIEIEEFKGLYDQVVYLDNKDLTNAKEVAPNHPSEDVVREMVNQMLYYIC